MAHLHVSTAGSSAALAQVKTTSLGRSTGTVADDLWISDLSNDLGCFGLCDVGGNDTDGRDELGRLSLTSDLAEDRGMSRLLHDKLGF